MKLARRRAPFAATLAALALAAILGQSPAQAAFPGRPGQIAYSQSTSNGLEFSGGIFVHGPRLRQAPHQLTEGEDSSPAFSANGRTIAFVGYREAVGPSGSTRPHIYVMNADGSGVRQLTSGDSYDYDPAFSPDGREVVFGRQGAGGGTSHIFAVDVDGSGLRELTAGPATDSEPVFTPDGRRIVFVSNRDASSRRDRSNVFSMAPDGSAIKLLVGGPRADYEPDVSPSGRRIVFVSTRGGGPDLYVATGAGRKVHALTKGRHDCFRSSCWSSPVWSPDERHIAALRSGRYSTSLEVIRADGTGAREFASGGTEEEGYGTVIGPPSWGPAPR